MLNGLNKGLKDANLKLRKLNLTIFSIKSESLDILIDFLKLQAELEVLIFSIEVVDSKFFSKIMSISGSLIKLKKLKFKFSRNDHQFEYDAALSWNLPHLEELTAKFETELPIIPDIALSARSTLKCLVIEYIPPFSLERILDNCPNLKKFYWVNLSNDDLIPMLSRMKNLEELTCRIESNLKLDNCENLVMPLISKFTLYVNYESTTNEVICLLSLMPKIEFLELHWPYEGCPNCDRTTVIEETIKKLTNLRNLRLFGICYEEQLILKEFVFNEIQKHNSQPHLFRFN